MERKKKISELKFHSQYSQNIQENIIMSERINRNSNRQNQMLQTSDI